MRTNCHQGDVGEGGGNGTGIQVMDEEDEREESSDEERFTRCAHGIVDATSRLGADPPGFRRRVCHDGRCLPPRGWCGRRASPVA